MAYTWFNSSEEDDEDDEDDDEQELQAELQRIRAEREQAQAKRDREDRLLQERVTKDAAVKGNPLAYIEQNSAKVRGYCYVTVATDSH